MLQLPRPFAVAVPIIPLTEDIRVIVLFASAVPVKVGVVSLVLLSVLELPVSVPAVILGAEGAGGTVASMVMARDEDATPVFPAASAALAVML